MGESRRLLHNAIRRRGVPDGGTSTAHRWAARRFYHV